MRSYTFAGIVASFLEGCDEYDRPVEDVLQGGINCSLFTQGGDGVRYTLRSVGFQEILCSLSGIGIHNLADGARHQAPPLSINQCLTITEGRHGRMLWYAVYPQFSTNLREQFLRWLSEPMPETWIFACDERDIGLSSDPLPILSFRENTHGVFLLGIDANRVRFCTSAWKVCDAGVSRFEFLKQAEQIMAHPLNPYTSRLMPDSPECSVVIHFRPDERWRYRHAHSLLCNIFPGKQAAVADMLTLLASKLGYTTLDASDLSALIATWGVAAAQAHLDIHVDYRQKNSPLLLTHIASNMDESELDLALSLLNLRITNSRHRSKSDPVQTCGRYALGDVQITRLLCNGQRVTHRDLFDSWMVARAQLGLPIVSYEDLRYERYLQLITGQSPLQADEG